MTVTLTYDSGLGRVRISATGLGGGTTHAVVDRSTNGIRWTTVRGGSSVAVSSGVLPVPLDDYEYPVGQAVTYRVQGIDPTAGAPTYVGVGAGSAGSSGSRTPALPASIVADDVLLLLASARTGTPDTPAGWAHLAGAGSLRLYGREYDGVFTAPTVTYTGGATDEDTLAQIAAFRGVSLTSPVTQGTSSPSLTQNIPFNGLPLLPELRMLVIYAGWKQDAWTSVANLVTGYTNEISELTSTAGNNAGQVWDYYFPDTPAAISNGSFIVTGGTPTASRAVVVALRSATLVAAQTAVITPTAGYVWVKSLARPFLNKTVDARLAKAINVTRRSRTGVFSVIDRSKPIAVTSVGGSKEWTMLLRTSTAEDRDDMDRLLSSGDVLLVQAPANTGLETGYVVVGDVTRSAHPLRPLSNLYSLPLTEVAPPGPDVVGKTGTWQTVVNRYATWADLIADNATWADVLNLVGDPDEVIVP